MPKRLTERQELALKLERLSDSDIVEVLQYVALLNRAKAGNSCRQDDELVATLSEAQENRRARRAFASNFCVAAPNDER